MTLAWPRQTTGFPGRLIVAIAAGTVLSVVLGGAAARSPHAAVAGVAVFLGIAGLALAAWLLQRGDARAAATTMLRGERAVTALVFLACLTYSWSGVWRGPQGLRIVDIFIVALLVVILAQRRGPRHAYFGVMALAMGLFAAGTALAARESTDHAGDAVAFLRTGFVLVVLPTVLIHTVTTSQRMTLAMVAVALSATTSALAAMAHRFADIWLLPIPMKPVFQGVREYGLGGHPLYLGTVACGGLAIVAALALSRRAELRPLALAGVPILLIGVALSATRGPSIGVAAVGLVLLAGLAAQRPAALAPAFAGAVLVGLAVLLAFPNSVNRLSNIGTDDRSTATRLSLYEQSLDDIFANPFAGYGAYLVKGAGGLDGEIDYDLVEGAVTERFAAHNVWLQTWLATGMLGLTALVVAAGAPLIATVEVMRKGRPDDRIFALGLCAAFIGTLVSTMFYSVVFDREVWLLPALAVALWANYRRADWEGAA